MKYALLLTTLLFAQATFANALKTPGVKEYIHQTAQKHHFSEKKLRYLFSQVHISKPVIHSMNHPAEAMTWDRYKKIMITQARIDKGVAFWKMNQRTLERAEKEFKVDPSIVVATIGVESNYGMHVGDYRVIDALSTLAFSYPNRQRFFKSELTQFLLLSREKHLNPLDVKGSYAGAIGQPQFMPSSYRRFAVKYTTEHQRINLTTHPADIIASIANYYHQHGWQYHKATFAPAYVHDTQHLAGIDPLHPRYSIHALQKYDIITPEPIHKNAKLSLIKLPRDEGSSYFIGFNNFATIMRYNTSPLYAMAVSELGKKITLAYQAQMRVTQKPKIKPTPKAIVAKKQAIISMKSIVV